jgi:hypothetical protein
MKVLFGLSLFVFLIAQKGVGQDKLPPIDKSPLDVSYCPSNYPLSKVQDNSSETLVARVIYSRPATNGRKIFGALLEYGKIWRIGANEATEIEFFKDVYINKTKVKKGRYTLYAIPYEKKWTLIINKETDTWGAFIYNKQKDVLRMDLNLETMSQPVENLTIIFDKTKSNVIGMQVMWENAKVILPMLTTN